MDGLGSLDRFVFEGFRFDLAAGGLFRTNDAGVAEPVALNSRGLALLALFIERRGRLVSKDEIFAAVWPGIVVGESNLTVQISALRRVLDRDRTQGSCIQTIPGRGYRFIPPVTRAEGDNVLSDRANIAIQLEGSAAINGAVVANPDKPSIAVLPLANTSGDVDEPEPEAVTSPDSKRVPLLQRWHRAGIIGTSALGLLLLILAIGWRSSLTPRIDAADITVPRLSIVVLPFANLSDDREQQYFADGVTEDLTTDLSRISGSFVISRNTAFTYRDKPISSKQIGRELGVRYVLEGSVQRSAKQVRVNAQLIDAETDAHLWAERFERDIDDLFALQNEITGRIAIAFNLALVNAEAQRPTEYPDVMDYIFRGRAEMLKPVSPDSYGKAIGLFEHALAIDPHSVEAQSSLASVLTARVLDRMSTLAAADIARAEGLVAQALATSPNSLLAHYAKAQVLRAQAQNLGMWNQYDEAILEYETVLASNPHMLGALLALANCKIFTGLMEEAVPLAELVMRLSPRDPQIWFPYFQIGVTRLLQSRIDEAIVWAEKARNADPVHPAVRALLASAYGLKGETERAAAQLAEARRLGGSYSSIAEMRAGIWGAPKLRALSETTFFAGMRKAGVPEE